MVEIQDLSRCSISLVYKVIHNYRDFGQGRKPFNGCGGCTALSAPSLVTGQGLLFHNALMSPLPWSIHLGTRLGPKFHRCRLTPDFQTGCLLAHAYECS